jgi:hypothetical protein
VVRSHGNVLSAIALLEGMAAGELRDHELAHEDPQYPLLITVLARKSSVGATGSPAAPELTSGSNPCGLCS